LEGRPFVIKKKKSKEGKQIKTTINQTKIGKGMPSDREDNRKSSHWLKLEESEQQNRILDYNP